MSDQPTYEELVLRCQRLANIIVRNNHDNEMLLRAEVKKAKAQAWDEVLTVLQDEIEDAPPANYEEDNYEAGYIDGLMFAEKFTETRANQYKEQS